MWRCLGKGGGTSGYKEAGVKKAESEERPPQRSHISQDLKAKQELKVVQARMNLTVVDNTPCFEA